MMTRAFLIKGQNAQAGPYHYTACGLDDVYLLNGYKLHKTPYGDGVAVQNVEGLHQAIADSIVRNKALLGGKEIRFLRKQMDLTQSDLAGLLRCNQQTIARWEKDQAAVNGAADAMIKVFYASVRLGKIDAAELLKELSAQDMAGEPPQVFEETEEGWKRAA